MTLSTSIHIGAPVNPELVFLKCREIIGIPAEWPFTIIEPGLCWGNGHWIASQPGGFRSALDVSHAAGSPLAHDLDDPSLDAEDLAYYAALPVAFVDVRLDTTYGYRSGIGETCGDVHREVCARLGEWLDGQGVDWWAQDEYTGDWHHRTPCPIDSANDRSAVAFLESALSALGFPS